MFYNQYFNSIISIQNRVREKKGVSVMLLGVSGPDAAGKTIFAGEYADFLRGKGHCCEVINGDDFLAPSATRYKLKDPVLSYYHHAFEFERLERLLTEIRDAEAGAVLRYDVYDRGADRVLPGKEIVATPGMTVITEGVLLFRDGLKRLLDMKIYLQADYATIEKRVFKRDHALFGEGTIKRYRKKYFPVNEKHLNEDDPVSAADIIIKGDCGCLNIAHDADS